MHILRAGALYFAVVFAAGFALGTIRVLWVVPMFGTRTAELLEAPIMLAVTIFAARWIITCSSTPATRLGRLGVGLIALALLLTAEFTVVLWIQGRTIADYIASRDPVAGLVYVILLAVFAVMPAAMPRRRQSG